MLAHLPSQIKPLHRYTVGKTIERTADRERSALIPCLWRIVARLQKEGSTLYRVRTHQRPQEAITARASCKPLPAYHSKHKPVTAPFTGPFKAVSDHVIKYTGNAAHRLTGAQIALVSQNRSALCPVPCPMIPESRHSERKQAPFTFPSIRAGGTVYGTHLDNLATWTRSRQLCLLSMEYKQIDIINRYTIRTYSHSQ